MLATPLLTEYVAHLQYDMMSEFEPRETEVPFLIVFFRAA